MTHVQPSLAINPRDPNNLLGASKVQPAASGPAISLVPCTYASFDRGHTWQNNGILPLPPGYILGSSDLSVAFDPQGYGYVAATEHGTSGGGVLVWRTDDGGHNFNAPVIFAIEEKLTPDEPWLAIDKDGTLYLAFDYVSSQSKPGSAGTDKGVALSRSFDHGASFEKPRVISDPRSEHQAGQPVVTIGPGKAIHVLYSYSDERDDYYLALVNSPDDGQHWDTPITIPHVPRKLPQPYPWMHNQATSAVDPVDGTYYVAYYAYRTGGKQLDIQLTSSHNNGKTWSALLSPTSTLRAGEAVPYQAQLAVSSRGTVYLSYYAYANGHMNVVLARALKHGATLDVSRQISDAPFDPSLSSDYSLGDYQGLAMDSDAIHPFWTDTRTGHTDIFTATIPAR